MMTALRTHARGGPERRSSSRRAGSKTGRSRLDSWAGCAETLPDLRVAFLISDEASFLTGVSLDVDGGAHLGFLPGT